MTYKVGITDQARADVDEAIAFIGQDSPSRSATWAQGLFEVLESLSTMPLRHPLLVEHEEFDQPYREVRYYSHRIVYHVDAPDRAVTILRVYHTARQPLGPADLA